MGFPFEETLRANERKIKARFFIWVVQNLGDNWPSAAKQLEAVTKVKFRPETLRQNVKPSNRKAGKAAHEIRDIKRLKALYDFLIKMRYLSESELRDPANDSFAINAVRHLVTGGLELPSMKEMSRFRGLYTGTREDEETRETVSLYIDYAAPDKPVLAAECYELKDIVTDQIYERTFSDGWAIWNGEKFHLFLMRSEQQEALCCQVLQSRPAVSSQEDISDMAILRYEDAWHGELGKTEITITEHESRTDYRLSHPLDELCFFLTRKSEIATENTEATDG